MAWSRPTITSGVTRATKALFDAFGDGIDEAHSDLAQKANASSLAAKLDKTEAAASYVPVPGDSGTTGQVLAKTSTGTAWIAPPSGGGGTNLTKDSTTGMYVIGAGSSLTKDPSTGMYPIGV